MLNISTASMYNKQTPPVAFKAHMAYTQVHKNDGKTKNVNNYTAFMRDFSTLEFTRDYLKKHFPHGTNIAEFGCSLGQKSYSLLIVLDEINKNKKYKITGYDFPEVIKQINEHGKPLYGVSQYSEEEQILFPTYPEKSVFIEKPVKKETADSIRDKFYTYFNTFIPYSYYGEGLKNHYNKLFDKNNIVVTPNKQKTKDLIQFKSGNIKDIDKILEPKKTGAVIFQNALYHILSNGDDYDFELSSLTNISEAEDIFKKINKVLPQNGLFVLGVLPSDHIYSFELEDATHLAYINNKQVRVFDTSPVHRALRKSGFEPVYYSLIPAHKAYVNYKDVYLPAAWKKVRDVK